MDKKLKLISVLLALSIALLASMIGVLGRSDVPYDALSSGLSRFTRVWITSNRDQVPLEVQGYITQTADLLQLKQAGGTVVISATNAGGAYFAGDVGIGTTGPDHQLTVGNGADSSDIGRIKLYGAQPLVYYSDSHAGYVRGWITQAYRNVFRIQDMTASADRLTIDSSGNVGIGTTTPGGGTTVGTQVLSIGDGTEPVGGVANQASFFSKAGEMWVMDSGGNKTQLSPHGFELFDPDPDEPYPWSYYACNEYLGKCVNVDIAGAIRAVEELSGRQFIYYRDVPQDEVLSWAERSEQVEIEVTIAEAVEAYSETITIETGEWITTTTTSYEFDSEMGQVVEVTEVVTTPVTEQRETGVTSYRLREGCRLDAQSGLVYCMVKAEPEPMPGWMQQRITLRGYQKR